MYFTPTLSSKETSAHVREFVSEHRSELGSLMKSILPFLLFFLCANLYVQYFLSMAGVEFMRDVAMPETLSGYMQLMTDVQRHSYGNILTWVSFVLQISIGYCFAVIAVSWHRLVLLGRGNYEPMDFLKPQKHELDFVIMWTMLGTILPASMVFFFQIDLWLIVLTLIILPYLFFKVSFYFPAKALNSSVSLKSSFQLTSGYFWKFSFAIMRSCIRVGVIYFLFALIVGSIAASLAQTLYGDQMTSDIVRSMYEQLIGQSIMSVILVFLFQPLFTVLGVTVLSNYFQHAMQNKTVEG
ncbi:MAG: hypothetical protein COA45_08865 [Zetaproteobacteria bacterium]|nr:MAG: hypothetical protein COA45_08865 [Zetaproteobacteria bacterium]